VSCACDRSAKNRNLPASILPRAADHVDQIAPSPRSTCRTSLAAMRRTQICRGPMTSTVAQNSSDAPRGHIDSASTSILRPSWQTIT
jgi:hypothetical protein